MTPAELSGTVLRSVRGAVEEQELSVAVPARIVVQPPPRPGCGDYASNVALQLAKPAGRPAREVAEILRKRLAGSPGIARVEIAGPGFLNFTLGDDAQVALVRQVLAQGAGYGDRSAAEAAAVAPTSADAVSPAHSPADSLSRPTAVAAARSAREAVVAEALARIDAAAGVPDGRQDRADTRPAPAPLPPNDPADPLVPSDALAPADLLDLLRRLGSDEARWVLLRPAAHDPVRAPERPVQRESNPRFRVQYAHARVRALLRNAGELGFSGEPGDVGPPVTEGFPEVPDEASRRSASGGGASRLPDAPARLPDAPARLPDTPARLPDTPARLPDTPARLPDAPARALQGFLALLAAYPSAVEAAARLRAPDRVVRHLEATADAFFRWHDEFPPLPVGEQKPSAVHRARLALAEAGGTVLANGLRLLGISAPEHL
ncbi:ArgS-related anticodon-binding protein NrtL [Streptomyces kronopolitis]|uniref:ArgS-related anticodon-binding protein NrtL n=1 Tax=Streptomyces kronopolitis TaxID=1612435 RepID=UPI0020BD72A5|nr:DALR anticodon-binding domain-containing protein [Streptomyces kronopolitis]MCL6300223.1 DALR anticodon-binding domain-containing protein [Streptomyces kronopolitis]